MIRIVLADDHETVREGLRLLIDSQTDMKVIGEAADGAAALERVSALRPDVLVLDLTMPGVSGVTAARELHASPLGVKVVALTRHDDDTYVKELLKSGVSAYVLKQSPSSVLLKAIREVASGVPFLDPSLPTPSPSDPKRRPTTPRATDREAAVLRMMAVGESNKEIASALGISVKTVEVHKANAMRKLGLRGRTDVVRYAAMSGWLKDP